jgi:hypothetical protein
MEENGDENPFDSRSSWKRPFFTPRVSADKAFADKAFTAPVLSCQLVTVAADPTSQAERGDTVG